jgi:penicillin-binding protein 2
LAIVAIIAVAGGVLYTSSRLAPRSGIGGILSGCGDNTPCAVAQDYVTNLTGGKYEAIYGLTSNASRQQFSQSSILGSNYKDAHDYIVNRTQGILSTAQIISVSGSIGNVNQPNGATATVPARLVYTSARVGTFTEDISIPLVSEQGQWHVTWTPGLIFPQLDDQADPNYLRHVRLTESVGKRGTIYDGDQNNPHPVAQDAPVWRIIATPSQVKDESQLTLALSVALGTPAATLKTNYETPWYCGPQGERLLSTMTTQPPSSLQTQLSNIPGISVSATTGRVYPYGQALAAVTGYAQEVSADQIKSDTAHYYANCDLIGTTGVEAWGEQYLRPVKGGVLKIVNTNADGSDGSTAYTIASRDPANGDDIHTTINVPDQQSVMAQLVANHNGRAGASFAVDPTTGAVLVLASNPACDPNAFAQDNFAVYMACVNDSTHQPLVDYALEAQVPTGSIFKIVTLAAALQNGVVSPTQQFQLAACYQIPGTSAPTCPKIKEPCQVVLDAMQGLGRSCDNMYWMFGVQLGEKDPTLLPNMARAFGFGTSPGVVGLPDDEQGAGLVPDPQYYQQHNIGNWAPVNSANLAIGQDLFQATPAQVALLSAAIGNNGVRMQPRLVTSVTSGPTVLQTFPAKQIGTVPVSATNLALVQVGMEDVVAPNGTSYDVFKGFPIQVAGKTGTAESGQDNPHAWFTYYAPASPPSGPAVQPQIAMSVLFTYAGFGDANAAPVCRALLITHFHLSGS